MRHLVAFLGLAGVFGCGPAPVWDNRPPRLVDSGLAPGGRELVLEFDEPVVRAEAAAGPVPPEPGPPRAPVVDGRKVRVEVAGKLQAGQDYPWKAEVEDAGANTTAVGGRFYGPNSHPADLRLNEVRVSGSGPHPDFLELRADHGGSLGGWTVEYQEGAGKPRRLVLEDREVAPGTLVLLYLRKPADAKHPEAAAGAVVLLWPGDEGLSATRGRILLRPTPTAEPADSLEWPAGPAAKGPAVDPAGATATRTWCRTETQPAAWMLVDTGSATPGGPNRLTPWEGQPSSRKSAPKSSGTPGARRRPGARPAGPWSRQGKDPRADEEADGPAVRASGPRTSPRPGLPASRALPRPARRRRRGRPGAEVPRRGAGGEEAGVRRPDRRG